MKKFISLITVVNLACILIWSGCAKPSHIDTITVLTESETVNLDVTDAPLIDFRVFLDLLQTNGFTVTYYGDNNHSLLTVDCNYIRIGEELISIYEYASAELMESDASCIEINGMFIRLPDGSTKVQYDRFPHWYKKDTIIAHYVGERADIILFLDNTLAFFAGYEAGERMLIDDTDTINAKKIDTDITKSAMYAVLTLLELNGFESHPNGSYIKGGSGSSGLMSVWHNTLLVGDKREHLYFYEYGSDALMETDIALISPDGHPRHRPDPSDEPEGEHYWFKKDKMIVHYEGENYRLVQFLSETLDFIAGSALEAQTQFSKDVYALAAVEFLRGFPSAFKASGLVEKRDDSDTLIYRLRYNEHIPQEQWADNFYGILYNWDANENNETPLSFWHRDGLITEALFIKKIGEYTGMAVDFSIYDIDQDGTPEIVIHYLLDIDLMDSYWLTVPVIYQLTEGGFSAMEGDYQFYESMFIRAEGNWHSTFSLDEFFIDYNGSTIMVSYNSGHNHHWKRFYKIKLTENGVDAEKIVTYHFNIYSYPVAFNHLTGEALAWQSDDDHYIGYWGDNLPEVEPNDWESLEDFHDHIFGERTESSVIQRQEDMEAWIYSELSK